MKVVLIAGGTGFIGRQLQNLLENEGFSVRILSRNPQHKNEFFWNPTASEIDHKALLNVQFIINLCGANIGEKRWTTQRKQELYISRIQPTQFLASLITEMPQLEAYITSSGITCYGFDEKSELYSETDPFGDDYLSQLVKSWEEAADLFSPLCRVVKLRTAVVLDSKKGAFPTISLPIRYGVGSALGSGKQILSWIHTNDLIHIFLHAINHPLNGSYNAVAGNESNYQFSKTVAKVMHKPFFFPAVPSFLLKAILGERADIVLKGVATSNKKIIKSGFEFEFQTLESALKNVLEIN